MTNELNSAMEIVREAGNLILTYFRGGYEVKQKSRDNPVTTADIESDVFLKRSFAAQFPDDGWLSEETADDGKRLSSKRVWVVDPIDGTKEFVRGLPEFAVSVGLVSEGQPILGIIYNPLRNEMFTAVAGQGCQLNGEPILIPGRQSMTGCLLLSSRSENSPIRRLAGICRIEKLGSIAYKLGLIAGGRGDLVLSFKPKNEWDICAGWLLVHEAGGLVTDIGGRDLKFNQPSVSIDGVIAANPSIHAQCLQWLRVPRGDGCLLPSSH